MSASTPAARNIVRNIIGTSERALTTREIFDLAGKKFPDAKDSTLTVKPLAVDVGRKAPPLPPRNGHPIRSMNHLKQNILPELVGRLELDKQHIKNSVSQTGSGSKSGKVVSSASEAGGWVWRFRYGNKNPIPQSPSDPEPKLLPRAPKPPPKTHQEMYPLPENIHLNLRRRRARPAKVAIRDARIAELAEAKALGTKVTEVEV